MKTSHTRSRGLFPKVSPLEGRLLLAGNPVGTWIGQDGHDLAGSSSTLGPDDVQDVHIALSNLPADRTIAFADIQGLGGDDWQYQGGYGPWAAAIVRSPGSTTADLYFDPTRVETGRPFSINFRYDDGSTAGLWMSGGTANPNLRIPSAKAQLTWIGQDQSDYVGPTAAVGPDGLQDLHLSLTNLSATVPITAVSVASSGGGSWAYGQNPQGLANAQFLRNSDATRGDLYLEAAANLQGQTLTATITYGDGKTDSAAVLAGSSNPGLAQPASAPPMPVFAPAATAQWIGQDGQNLIGPGAARIGLSNLPTNNAVVGAILTDPIGMSYAWTRDASPSFPIPAYSNPLAFQSAASGRADLSFPPDRDEFGAALSLRLVFADGTSSLTQIIVGSTTDVGQRAPLPAATSVVAHPGDDLNALANQYGTVRLSAGIYPMSQPLTLLHPVTIVSDPGATIQFTQRASDPGWTAAIKIRAGHVTLDGFAVRFTGPVVWNGNVSYGAAVIGTTDQLDTGASGLVVGLTLSRLDIQSSPVAPGAAAVEAPGMIRLASGLGGTVSGCTLSGGSTTFNGGPWSITNNTYLGPVANTFSWTAFAGHSTHDVLLANNITQPAATAGKTWRFLVLTGSGSTDVISGNQVYGVGPRNTDTVTQNAPETILTEAYGLRYEGTLTGVSADRMTIQIAAPQGGTASAGDEVAILDGPNAGQYRRIVQMINSQTYVLASPLPAGATSVSIATGFVGESFLSNTIDAHDSTGAVTLVLVGNHYGTTVQGNHFIGGESVDISATPSESPDFWGWSHGPFLGVTIDGNTFEDVLHGVTLGVLHGSAIKTSVGRVYFSGSVTNNIVSWSSSFLAAHPAATLTGMTLGYAGSISPGENQVTFAGNASRTADGSVPSILVIAGSVNGQTLVNTSIPLNPSGTLALTGLALVNDTGASGSDALTNDARLHFSAISGAVGYEYRLAGSATYAAVASLTGFLPVGLVSGPNTVNVRAIDALGRRGPDAAITFTLDTTPPSATAPSLAANSGSAQVATVSAPSLFASGDAADTIILLRDGKPVAQRVGPGTLTEPAPLADGTYAYTVHRVDAAGNASDSPALAVTIRTTPAPVASGTWLGQDGHDLAGQSPNPGGDGVQDAHIALGGLRPDHAIAFVDIEGLGGGQWLYGGAWGPWLAALVRTAGATTADLYFQPDATTTARPFNITIRYDDGQTTNFWVQGAALYTPVVLHTTEAPATTTVTTSAATAPTTATSTTTSPQPAGPQPAATQPTPTVTIPVRMTPAMRRAARVAALKAAIAARAAARAEVRAKILAGRQVAGHSWRRR